MQVAKNRFYAPELLADDSLELSEEEGKHCTQVLRHKEGDHIILFDGNGNEAVCIIETIHARAVHVRVAHRKQTTPLPCAIHLAQAIPKGKTMDLIIQKAVELGATAIYPLLSEHTVVELDHKERLKKQEKWQAIAIEACKQCGQNRLPRIATPTPIKEFTPPHCDLNLIASLQPNTLPLKTVLHTTLAINRPSSVLIFIGPEGDFTPAEIQHVCSTNCQPISLGSIILRVETAAIYCLSIFNHELLLN